MNKGGAIVIGANYRALGVVRSLGRRGVPVLVIKETGDSLASMSRYVDRSLSWPTGDEGAQVEFLMSTATEQGVAGWLLIPTDDESACLIARHHESLAKQFLLTTPPWDILCWAYDKRLTAELARDLAIACPWTLCPRSREELVSVDCEFPLILKPAFKQSLNAFTAAKAWRVDDRQSLLARYDEACELVSPDTLIVQELVPGSGEAQFSYAALCKDGRPLASVTARRVRQIPMDFGRFSTYVETVDEPGVVEPAVRLLAAIRYTGLVEVEFKRDPRDGRHKLLDINPRVWGWHTLCARAGVDFTHLLWLMVRGETVPEVSARPGVRWIRTSADIPVAIQEILRGRLTLRAYARSLRSPIEHAIFACSDPLPGLLALPLLAYKLGRRAL
jgi:predicted ATP-grasp superfamily ATP-dependent carboligase